MAETAHTPGPWGFEPESGEIFHDDGNIRPLIATVDIESTSERQALADMRLMTAAPDLLEALRAIVDEFPVAAGTAKGIPRDEQGYGSIFRARAAIARATGEKE